MLRGRQCTRMLFPRRPVWRRDPELADSGDCGQSFRWIADSDSDRSRTVAPVDGKAVRSVHEAVEDGICDCRIDDHLVPVIDGELAGHDRGAAAVTIVDDF